MKIRLFALTIAAAFGLPFAGFAQGSYLSDPNDANNHALVVAPGGNVGIGTTSPSTALEVHREVLIVGNDEGGMEYNDWPVPSLSVRRSDNYVWNGVTMMSFGFRNDPNQFTEDQVANIRLMDPSQSPNAARSGNTTQLRIGSPGPIVLQPFSGNVGIGTPTPQAKLDVAGKVNCTVLELTSDRAQKSGFAPVDSRAILDQVSRLHITTWYYTNEPAVRHIGPVAQDFKAAFTVGSDDKHIATVDADGVLFAAVQALNQKLEAELQSKDARVAGLEKEVARLRSDFVSRLSALEKLVVQASTASPVGEDAGNRAPVAASSASFSVR